MDARDPAARASAGHEARRRVPAEAHADLPTEGRPGPVRVLGDQAPSRVPELVPIRHTRMPAPRSPSSAARPPSWPATSPAPRSRAWTCSCAVTPTSPTSACSPRPERALVFDVNDFDETYPGPWEWDLKRLAASLVVAGRANDFSDKQARRVVRGRRRPLPRRDEARSPRWATWPSGTPGWTSTTCPAPARAGWTRGCVKRLDKTVAKARTRNHLRSLAKLTEVVDGRRRDRGDPPLVVPVAELAADRSRDEIEATVAGILRDYRRTLAARARASWSTPSRSRTWPARSSGSAASGRGAGSC